MTATKIILDDTLPFKNGSVYFFHLDETAHVSKTNQHLLKHPHILLGTDPEYGIAYFMICSSDMATCAKLKLLFPNEIIDFTPDGRKVGNGLDKKSYVNCNEVRTIPMEDILDDYEDEVLIVLGRIDDKLYNKIKFTIVDLDDTPDIYEFMKY